MSAGGSSAIPTQRNTAPQAPTNSSTVGSKNGGSRACIANSTISAATPSPHSAAITVPSKPAARHCTAEKP